MYNAVIVQAKRTPVGKKNGIFNKRPPHELAAPVLRHLGERVASEIDDVILGNIVGPGGNIARLAALEAGLPLHVPGLTIDRQCSAGLEAIRLACCLIKGGAGKVYLAGGTESASTSPYPARARFAPESIGDPDMGVAAEYVARDYAVSREQQDEWTRVSYERSWTAFEQGLYEQEIVPVGSLETDEEFHKKRDIERLAKRAKAVFQTEEGTVTAVNSCGIHDGASAVLIMEERTAQIHQFEPILRFVDSEVAAVHPHHPAIAPVPAVSRLLARRQLSIDEVDLIEINEAFAVKIAACARELCIPGDKLNVRGGALALGHPYAASGAILVTRLFYETQRRPGVRYVLAALGSGGGVGTAVLFEAVR
ncbi:acetyl-CoA C-acyltransferase [Pseudobacillus badius]|uniref:acetyl-CoA C-acyltransferase n=1 Tax=Bacillus badius TaxID=1455 RepID=UPI0007B0B6E0|nr:acetyl-CoA C-acyltransferase [Bacillus badius]KZN98620.1 acetyl-CoA acetyltransferase [Bacillus badius]MED0666400.1 acetyl-CoA C-acyltransferase [Bacillus badius]OCS83559.1 acetyl-CoA acetyltransferase [Bacillus badius]OVE53156.1 acetyl-CoA acetyltransferase [Bacillus badius]TDW05210.1 acetyl-CoA C-acetyltransferase [Bacillus badius]